MGPTWQCVFSEHVQPSWAGVSKRDAHAFTGNVPAKYETRSVQMPGMINVDFADVRAVVRCGGHAHLATGVGSGARRALQATRAALDCPMLRGKIHGATGAVWSITGPPDLSLSEVTAAAEQICDVLHPDANVIFGSGHHHQSGDQVRCSRLGYHCARCRHPAGFLRVTSCSSKR
jgi:FtsZ family, C-terminal domain